MFGHRVGNLVAVTAFGDNDETVLAAQNPSQPGADQVLIVDQQHGDVGTIHLCGRRRASVNGISARTDQPSGQGPASITPPSSSTRWRIPGRPRPSCDAAPTATGSSFTMESTAEDSETSRCAVALDDGACLA